MPKRNYLILFILAACVISAVASFQTAPGYMDATYYYSGSVQLASGHGFQENFVWNYMDSPQGVPHPANTYWMPMASLLAALIPGILGKIDFLLARIPFIIIGASLAPVTASLAYSLTKNPGLALFSGVIAAFPGYYLPCLPTTDTFGVYMLLGSTFLVLAVSLPSRFDLDAYPKTLLLGVNAGLMHLSRADGLLWLGFGVIAVLWAGKGMLGKREQTGGGVTARFWQKSRVGLLGAVLCVLLGYLVVMAPWLMRNLSIYGTLLSPGASRAIWQRSYEELYNFPPETVNFSAWWAQGLGVILQQRLDALGTNLKNVLGVQMDVLLAPFMLVGLWQLRRAKLVQMAVVVWFVTIGVMSFIFPFSGTRGGFFHSGSAVQPILWAAAPSGFAAIVGWVAKKRRWQTQTAINRFAPGLSLILILFTGMLSYQEVIGPDLHNPIWNWGMQDDRRVEDEIRKLDPSQKAAVLVNNPASYSLVSDRPAFAIPNGDIHTLLAVAQRYHVEYVVMDENPSAEPMPVQQQPEKLTGLAEISTVDRTLIFRVETP